MIGFIKAKNYMKKQVDKELKDWMYQAKIEFNSKNKISGGAK